MTKNQKMKRNRISIILAAMFLFGILSSYAVSGSPFPQENTRLIVHLIKEDPVVNETTGQIIRIYRSISNQGSVATNNKPTNESARQIDKKIHQELNG